MGSHTQEIRKENHLEFDPQMKGNRRGLLLGQDLDLLNLNQFLFCMYLLHLLDDSRLHLYSCLIHLDLLHLDLLDLDRKKDKKSFFSFWVGMTRRV